MSLALLETLKVDFVVSRPIYEDICHAAGVCYHSDRLALSVYKYGPRLEKTCLLGYANSTGADQPAHPCSLISAFVIGFLESNICNFATGNISSF